MSALLGPFLPYIVGAVVAILGAGGFIWKTKRDARQAGIDEQKVKEAEARDLELERIKRAAGARPAGGVSGDPDNRDNWQA
jgi:hypothetical protein